MTFCAYLGCTFNMNSQDDNDMLRQMRTLYNNTSLDLTNYYALFYWR